ncbi:MAG: MtrB/PioB family decaheme-associated outer membrane protein [Acidobacteria bacterium]|nr:MtrB/PioB family decaheme-associated outer membrane protein [Acidobacteriota bacterium]
MKTVKTYRQWLAPMVMLSLLALAPFPTVGQIDHRFSEMMAATDKADVAKDTKSAAKKNDRISKDKDSKPATTQGDTPPTFFGSFKYLFEIGGQLREVSGERPSKFEQFRKVREGVLFRRFKVVANPQNAPSYFRLLGREPSELDQHYRLEMGKYSAFRTTVEWNGLPYLYANGIRSSFGSSAPGILTVANSVRQSFQTLPSADLPNAVQSFIASRATSRLRVQRQTFDFTQSLNLTDSWSIRFRLWDQKRYGAKPLGTGSYERVGTPVGDTFNVLAIELPESVDTRTTQFSVGTSFLRSKWGVNFDFTHSKFTNHISTLTFDNPFRISDLQATGTGGVFNRMAFARGIFALPPSNDADSFLFSGFIDLPHHSRWASAVGWSRWHQNELFAPFTLNSAIVASGLPAGTSVTSTAALPRPSLEGKVDTLTNDHLFTSRLLKNWTMNLHYNAYDYDNNTEHIKFPGYAAFGESFWRTNINNKPIENEPVSFLHQMASAESVWQIAKPLTWEVEYKLDVWNRANRQVRRSNEHTIGSTLNYKPSAQFSGRLSYHYADRSPIVYDPGVLEFNRLRMFDQAKRLRHDVNLQWQYHLNPQLGLSGTFGYLSDDYDQNFFGLTQYVQGYGSIDVLYNVNENTTFYANYARERYASSLQSIAKTAVPFDLANRWNRDERDLLNTFGAGITTYLVKDKLFLDVHYAFSQGTTRITTLNPTTPSSINVLNATAYPFPDVKTRLNEFNADVNYQFAPNLTIGMRYIYEPYHLEDFAWDGLTPYPFNNLTSTQDGRRFLLLDSRYSSHRANVFGAYMKFSF